MRGADDQPGSMFSYVSLEDRVPQDHPLRAVRRITDRALERLSPRFGTLYVKFGRPSVPMEVRSRVIPVGRSEPRREVAIATYPAPDTADVYRVVKVFLSEPSSGLDATTFTLRDGGGSLVPASVDQIGDGTWALFPHQVFLKANETYTARIDGRLCRYDGHCTSTRRVWRFTTAPMDAAGNGDTRVPPGFVRGG